jgi:hypothetical protein
MMVKQQVKYVTAKVAILPALKKYLKSGLNSIMGFK